jgi:UDP-2,3-diacylglucosamine pyrophosphatase LpxH
MMQKAMELKKKKNLEPLKGNPFLVLHGDKLSQIARGVDLEIGMNDVDTTYILANLMRTEQVKYIKKLLLRTLNFFCPQT